MTILLDVTHGSHLYGLAHAGSDFDRFVVVSNRPGGGPRKARWAKQTVADGVDTTTVDLSTFSRYASMGAHQYVEAMYAPDEACKVDLISDFRHGFRVSPAMARDKYLGAIFSFAQFGQGLDGEPTFKAARHAMRLALCWAAISRGWRFNPRMPEWSVKMLDGEANLPRIKYLTMLTVYAPELRGYTP